MTLSANSWFTVNQLLILTEKEIRHLKITAERIRRQNPDIDWVHALEEQIDNSEMLDAFVARFGRLQDTLGDKLLPAVLKASLEKTGTQLDNLLRAEKLGWLDSAEQWIAIRLLRNRLIHEYMDSAEGLLQALLAALEAVPVLESTQTKLAHYIKSKA